MARCSLPQQQCRPCGTLPSWSEGLRAGSTRFEPWLWLLAMWPWKLSCLSFRLTLCQRAGGDCEDYTGPHGAHVWSGEGLRDCPLWVSLYALPAAPAHPHRFPRRAFLSSFGHLGAGGAIFVLWSGFSDAGSVEVPGEPAENAEWWTPGLEAQQGVPDCAFPQSPRGLPGSRCPLSSSWHCPAQVFNPEVTSARLLPGQLRPERLSLWLPPARPTQAPGCTCAQTGRVPLASCRALLCNWAQLGPEAPASHILCLECLLMKRAGQTAWRGSQNDPD